MVYMDHMKETTKIKYKIYRIRWWLVQYLAMKRPVHVDVETNNTCNQKCLSCWHSQDVLPFRLGSMKLGDVERIIDEASRLGVKSIKFNYRGEPSLYKYITDVIDYAKRKGIVDVMINTNGIMSRERLIDIIKAGITTLIISVDSFKSNVYSMMHNTTKRIHSRLLGNLIFLNRLKQLKLIKTTLVINIHKSNLNNSQEDEEHDKQNIKKLDGFIVKTRYTEDREGDHIAFVQHKNRKKRCPHMMRRLAILVNGKVYPCCMSYLEPNDLLLGNISENKLADIWNGEKRKKLISDYAKGVYVKSCKNCKSGDIWKR